MSRFRIVVAACAALALTPVAAACSGGGGHHAADPAVGASTSLSNSLVATRWWSNSAAPAGSTIDPKHPTAVAAKLHTSPADYCGMLRQTVAAGRSILPNVTVDDPALLTSTRAFVAELQAVAPSPVAGPWQVLGSAVLTIVESGGDPATVKRIDAAAVRAAASTVAADAKHSCGVDLSSGPSRKGGGRGQP